MHAQQAQQQFRYAIVESRAWQRAHLQFISKHHESTEAFRQVTFTACLTPAGRYAEDHSRIIFQMR